MINYGKTRSTVKPEPIKIDDYSVWVHTNIQIVQEEIGDDVFEGYEYDMVRYDKDEYIKLMAESNSELKTRLTDTQLALCELYEGMV